MEVLPGLYDRPHPLESVEQTGGDHAPAAAGRALSLHHLLLRVLTLGWYRLLDPEHQVQEGDDVADGADAEHAKVSNGYKERPTDEVPHAHTGVVRPLHH